MLRLQKGVTLVELLVTLAILATLFGIALPSFANLIRDNRLAAASNELLAVVRYVRSEAIKRGRRVTLCVSSDQLSCTPGSDWHGGWLVFVDDNGNGLREVDEEVLRMGADNAGALTIIGNTHVRNYLSYNAEGRTQLVSGGLQMGTVTLCGEPVARRLVINSVGRPRVERGVC
jgi:type IV fimbrial biogenesis protein FimT